MLNEILLGLYKSLWFIIPFFGTLVVGAIYEQKAKRN